MWGDIGIAPRMLNRLDVKTAGILAYNYYHGGCNIVMVVAIWLCAVTVCMLKLLR